MQAELAEKLANLRIESQLTQTQLGKALGITRQRISAFERGEISPSIDVLKQYATHFSTDIRKLIYSDAELTLLEEKPRPMQILTLTVNDEGSENIEFVPVKAAAGYATGYGNPEFVRELPRMRLPFIEGGTHRAFEILGDSMLPIPSGAIVIGRYVETIPEIRRNDTYIFVTRDDGIVFKRVADISRDRILLQSDNPLYASFALPLSEIREVWKAKLWMSYMFERKIS